MEMYTVRVSSNTIYPNKQLQPSAVYKRENERTADERTKNKEKKKNLYCVFENKKQTMTMYGRLSSIP